MSTAFTFLFGEKVAVNPRALMKTVAGLTGQAPKAVPTARVTGAGTTQMLAPQSVTSALPAWLRQNQAVAKGVNPSTGLKPGAQFQAPPAPPTAPKLKITPEEIAAAKPAASAVTRPDPALRQPLGPEGWGRAPVKITPEQAAAAQPLPKTPGLRTPAPANAPGMIKTQSALEFGAKVAFSLSDPKVLGGLGGAALGGLGGAVMGAMDPGYEEDEDGRKRKRSRLMAALRGGLGGAGVGALGGAGFGAFAPKDTQSKMTQVGNQLANRAYAATGGVPDARYVPTDVYMRAVMNQKPFDN